MCGKEGFKKSKGKEVLDKNGNPIPNYICEFRNPFDYYAIINKEGVLQKCVFTKEETENIDPEFFVEKRSYQGCPHFEKTEDSSFLV